MENNEIRLLADALTAEPGTPEPPRIHKAIVTALSSPTFTARIEGADTTVAGLTISKPFLTTLAVNSVVWLLNQGPIYLLIHQES